MNVGSELKLLRTKNIDLFEKHIAWLAARRENIFKIRKLKKKDQKFKNFDPKWEFEFFIQYQDSLKLLLPKELLSYTLIMEAHSQEDNLIDYPSWSSGVHCNGDSWETRINPILLFISRPALYKKLMWRAKWLYINEFLQERD